ncbi:MAG: hypothetical protein PVG49_06840 [Desulfobacteraceae bacterium]|jgi:hypothetical protein
MKRRVVVLTVIGALTVGFIAGLVADRLLNGNSVSSLAYARESVPASGVRLAWQSLDSNISRLLHRAPVPGGWLVAQQNGLAFVPDPDREWKSK